MWMLPAFSAIARAAGAIYYRIEYGGQQVPSTGPVLVVANHPNSLLDPLLVSAAARRPVRFLAKAPLFQAEWVGWLIRGSGAIPVYRRSDDPSQVSRNTEMFRAVHAALAGGSAVGIFPEGLSHSDPSLAPLKTGAARIALGANLGAAFPIVPVGLVFRDKGVFRSSALTIVGDPIPWDDLHARGDGDAAAVRELTGRIEAALRAVTINLDRWEDHPLIDAAVGVWEATREEPSAPASHVNRRAVAARILADLRTSEEPTHTEVVQALRDHVARLNRLGLEPSDLARDTTARAAVRWAARRLFLISLPAVAVGVTGFLFFWLPYTATGRIAMRLRPDPDRVSTYKLMVGIATYGLWLAVVATAAAFLLHPLMAPVVLIVMPLAGIVGRAIRERWSGAWSDALGFLRLRSRRALIEELRADQAHLSVRLEALYAAAGRVATTEGPDAST